jgi:peroxiredoxin
MKTTFRKYTILFLSYLIFQKLLFAQQIEITVADLDVAKATISELSGEKATLIDSVQAKTPGQFTFALKPGQNHPGIFRLSFGNNKWIDFINDGEDVRITTNARSLSDSMKVLASESNLIYHTYVKLNKQYKTKSELLQLVLSRYPKDDPFYASTRAAAEKLQKDYKYFVTSAPHSRPGSFIARYVRSSQMPIVDFNKSLDEQLKFLKSHALDSVNFNDDGLIYSDLFTNKSIEYLMYYRNPQLPKELLEKEFMVAVDTILSKARVNQIVYQHSTEYLIDGFKKFGFEKCIDYILDNYVIKDDLCLGDKLGNTVQRMIEQKKKLAVGSVAPNIMLRDTSGGMISLQSVKSAKSLIVFYSTSCPHCQSMIPKLAQLQIAKSSKELAILAVSLDSSRADWTKFIRKHSLGWMNVNDPKGWDGSAASDYFIYATPTLILLDKDKRIIATPTTIEELNQVL